MSPLRAAAILVTASLVTAACGADGPGEVVAGPLPEVALDEAASDELLLSVASRPGFVGPLDSVRFGPRLVVFGDGQVLQDVTESLESGETPAVPTVEQRQLSEDGLAALYERLAEAGVTAEVDYGEPPVTDHGSLVLAVDVDDDVIASSVYAPGETEGLSRPEQAARGAVDRLLDDLGDLDELLGAGVSAAEEAEFDRWLAFTVFTDRFPGSGPGPADAILAEDWPLEPERAADEATALVCTDLAGPDIELLLDPALSEFDETLWELEDGSGVDLVLRPALNGDSCASYSSFSTR